MIVDILRVFAIICIAIIVGKLISKIKLPAILGWLITGILFGPYLVSIVSAEIMNSTWYIITVKFFECFAGVMIGKELIFKEIKSSGKQIIGITFIQSIATFLFVSIVFIITFLIVGIPYYLGFIFGGIALATAPAPALSIVNEYHTSGPVTRTLVPLAAIDDVIGVIIFFTVISIVGAVGGTSSASPLAIIGIVLLPFIIGIIVGYICSFITKHINNDKLKFLILMLFLITSTVAGLLLDTYVFKSFSLNYLLIGMAFSATLVNLIPKEKLEKVFTLFNPVLNFSLIVVIVNLGMPLDYKLIAGAGAFTAIYIIARAVGKIGGAFIGGKVTQAEPTVTKYLGLTLLPHSGVSLVFTGIAVTTLTAIDPKLATIVSGTIVAAAIINEIIAVLVAKVAFKMAGEMPQKNI
ncbi:MAG: cation:proton antiporter [Bacilli bacterium]